MAVVLRAWVLSTQRARWASRIVWGGRGLLGGRAALVVLLVTLQREAIGIVQGVWRVLGGAVWMRRLVLEAGRGE